MPYDSSQPYGLGNCDDAAICLAELVAADVHNVELDQVHAVWSAYQAADDETDDEGQAFSAALTAGQDLGIDPAVIMMIVALIEELLPVILQLLEDCQERNARRVARRIKRAGFLTRRKHRNRMAAAMYRLGDEASLKAAQSLVRVARKQDADDLVSVIEAANAA